MEVWFSNVETIVVPGMEWAEEYQKQCTFLP